MPPVITYNQNSATPFSAPDGASLQMMNKVGIAVLGHVLSSAEVVSGDKGNGFRLKLIVAHNDWDSQVKYVVPGTKNLRGTFEIYQVGCEVQITRNIDDFDIELQMAVVMVDYVALTQGHGSSQGLGLGLQPAVSPNKSGRNLEAPNADGPSASLKASISLPSTYMKKMGHNTASETSRGKGKAISDKEESSGETSASGKAKEPADVEPPKKKRGRPCNDILKAAAKQMKRT
ncbi:hypothetical protein PCASD_21257 [Puccinia coronata f. sp. avenae]|uniref:Uncharacterized protein n=1 Tax=Puccinia coronata f. sp. avenae TaxID=200324 RepID=A0A2N5U2E2_9BASI|nr:hypothetical protein PCASD_21257 [Puccinia coronata f. sp. avenae]